MTEPPDLLIGDAERTAAADGLRQHYEAGRLTVEELESRLDAVHRARTAGDLRSALAQLPSATLPTFRPADRRWRSLAVQYVVMNAIALLVWVFTGAQSDFWPKWVFLATLILFARRALGPSPPPRLPPPPQPPDPPR